MKNDIFISYSRHDTNVVNEIVNILENEGYSVWIDRDGIESGEDFKRVILKAIKESEVILFFSSEHSNVSDWTAKEIGVAVKYKKYIIPIMLDESNFNEAVEFDLINLDYVNYSQVSTRLVMREKLLKALRKKLGMGSKEVERLEAERKANEAAERAKHEKERMERAEAERKAKEAAERERQEKERLAIEEADRKAKEAAERERLECEQKIKQASFAINGHEYVDLGLPSGTLWATCNVGANKPEDYGDYFSWDEGKTAAVQWGKGWGMPSKEQWEELKENTKSTWMTRNSVEGRLFTANNGNSLFLPATGSRWRGELNNAGSDGYYWSSSLYAGNPYHAWYFYFNSGGTYMSSYDRSSGQSVRAVRSSGQN